MVKQKWTAQEFLVNIIFIQKIWNIRDRLTQIQIQLKRRLDYFNSHFFSGRFFVLFVMRFKMMLGFNQKIDNVTTDNNTITNEILEYRVVNRM